MSRYPSRGPSPLDDDADAEEDPAAADADDAPWSSLLVLPEVAVPLVMPETAAELASVLPEDGAVALEPADDVLAFAVDDACVALEDPACAREDEDRDAELLDEDAADEDGPPVELELSGVAVVMHPDAAIKAARQYCEIRTDPPKRVDEAGPRTREHRTKALGMVAHPLSRVHPMTTDIRRSTGQQLDWPRQTRHAA